MSVLGGFIIILIVKGIIFLGEKLYLFIESPVMFPGPDIDCCDHEVRI